MTSEELIEKEANERYPNRPVVLGRGNTCLSCGEVQRDAFKAGVEWQKNHVWHDSSEKPDEHKLILETDGKGAFWLHATNYMPLDENTRWAYVEDL